MRYGRRFVPVAIAMILVLGAVVLIGRGKSLRAQAPRLLKEAEKPADGPAPAPFELPSPPGAAESALPAESAPPPQDQAAPAPEPEDPDKAAEAFMNQTREQADARVKALTTEAEQLRARLKKVESAIGRWRSLRAALDLKPAQGQAPAVPPPAEPGLAAEPPLLESQPAAAQPLTTSGPALSPIDQK